MSAVPLPTLPPAHAALREAFDRLRAGYTADRDPPLAVRLDRLKRLSEMIERMAPAMVDAIAADFGQRSAAVTQMADILPVQLALRHTRRHLKDWMKTRRAPTSIIFRPGWNRLMRQPLGVVGIVSPWNYPGMLALAPAVAALAAGNRVMIKPSEIGPQFAELLRDQVARSFSGDELSVAVGDADVGRAFVALPWDHLLFTGSTAVGRQVAMAAAANLTPVTLELGGKSPVILNGDCDIERAALSVAAGKLLNAGQTCIAPDYVLLRTSMQKPFAEALRRAVNRLYPTLADNPDYVSIASDRHFARLQALLEEARAAGASVWPLHREPLPEAATRKLMPVLVTGAPESTRLMREEIFGPILPLRPYETLDEAIAYVNAHDRPLALYWFGRSKADQERVLRHTVAGGVTVNDTLWHIGQEDLPFGGVGASGMGAYHGEWGFRTFSKETGVFHQPAFNGISLFYPPYGKLFERLLGIVRRIG